MKKLIPILLSLLLLLGLMPAGAIAAEEKSETFICDGTGIAVEGEYFNLSARYIEQGGWSGGSRTYPLTITARDDGIRITHIDAHVKYYGYLYENVGVSCGRKVPESLGNSMAGDISVIDINHKDFAFANGSRNLPFDKITVYFETCEEDGHFYSDYVCVGCGKPRCEIEGHHSYGADNVCVNCELTRCEAEGHSYEPVMVYKCHYCGEGAPEGYTPEAGTGSVLSRGYPEILYGIGGLAIGVAATLLFSRKKKAAVSTADDEE